MNEILALLDKTHADHGMVSIQSITVRKNGWLVQFTVSNPDKNVERVAFCTLTLGKPGIGWRTVWDNIC